MTYAIEMPTSYVAMDVEEMQYLEGGTTATREFEETASLVVTRLSKIEMGTRIAGNAAYIVGLFRYEIAIVGIIAAEWFKNINAKAKVAYNTACNYLNRFGGNTTLTMQSNWNLLALESIKVYMK